MIIATYSSQNSNYSVTVEMFENKYIVVDKMYSLRLNCLDLSEAIEVAEDAVDLYNEFA